MSELLGSIRKTLTLLLILFSFSGVAAVYYVSSEGNDDNPGNSPELAWKTISKVNAYPFSEGDQILFRRGDVWRGTLHCNYSGSVANPIIYGAYGEGVNPVIYGSEVITGWTVHSGNIYKAPVSSDIIQVFIDGARARLARYPDQGYFTINSVSGTTTFTSNQLDTELNYTGATWFGRTSYYYGVIRSVISSSDNTVTINTEPDGSLGVNEGFVLMNKLAFLNQPGEWYYDKTDKLLYLWTPGGDSPENYIISGSDNYNGVHINSKNYLQISNLDLREQGDNGIFIYGGSNITLDNIRILHSDRYGISAEGASALVIKNNEIDRANGGGMWLWTRNSHIADNRINNTGVFEEIGIKGNSRPNGGSGAEISGESNIIEYNLIENSNYNGLFYRGAGSKIQYNHIDKSCLVKDDGGGIYTNTSGSGGFVRYNIVTNSVGNPVGFISSRSMAEGIYIDEIAENVTVENNTVYKTGDAAIKLHNVGGITVNNNTVMTARYGIWCNKFVGSPSPITNNIVYMTANKDDYEPRALFSRVGVYNTKFNYNKYYNPTVTASTQVFKESNYFTFTQWKAATKQDANSTFNSTSLPYGHVAELVYNVSKIPKKYNLNGAVVKDRDGNAITSSFILQPYTSIILTGVSLDKIEEVPDTIAPVISSISVPSVFNSLTVPVLDFTASDELGIAGYLLSEGPNTPLPDDTGWSAQVPASYTFNAPGRHTFYAWAKDATGNISESASATVTVFIPDYSPFLLEYLFEETSGATIVDTKGSMDGIIVDELIRIEGVKGKGLDFTGKGFINAGDEFGERAGDEVSVSLWIKPSEVSGTYQGLVVQEGQDSVTFALYINPDLKSIGFKTSGTTAAWVEVEQVEQLWDGNWHHVLVTYNGSEKIIYLDKNPLIQSAAEGYINFSTGFDLLIGANDGPVAAELSYKGLVDEVRIYNYGLKATEVNDLYHDVIDSTTSVGGVKYIHNLIFYPNPFSRYLRIELSGMDNNGKVEIFNASGTRIKSLSEGQDALNKSTFIWDGRNENGEDAVPGFYFVHVISGRTVNTGKVLKLR